MEQHPIGILCPDLTWKNPQRRIQYFFISLCLFICSILAAEGVQQAAPSSTDVVWLNIDGSQFGNFAAYGSANTTSGMAVEMKAGECLYLGLSAGTSSGNFTNFLDNYNFQIVDATGNIVHGPYVIDETNQNVSSYDQAAGPTELGFAGGYEVVRIENGVDVYKFCPAAAGTYWIEFQDDFPGSNLRIPLWDFTIGTAMNTAIPGRLYSQNWSFRTPSDGLDPGIFCSPFQRPFNGILYSYTSDGFVSKIDFQDSGFRGLTFNVAFDSDGPGTTGTMVDMRKSIEDANETANSAEHKIFLSPPDPSCFLDGACGEMTLLGLTCTNTGYCINLNVTQAGSVEILLDANANNIFDPNTADLIIVESIAAPGDVCVVWDGILGDGTVFMPGQNLTGIFSFTQGVQHYAAYDVEYLTDGFCVETVRPAGCLTDNKLYWDDTNINSISGTGQPNDGRNGCICQQAGCRTWDNFIACGGGSGPGYGNFNTMNTWWFAFISAAQVLDISLEECTINGGQDFCIGDEIVLTVDEVVDASYIWEGPNMASGNGSSFTLASATSADAGQYCVTINAPGGCGTICCIDIDISSSPSCVASNPISPSAATASDGAFDLTVSGGQASYSYVIFNSSALPVSSGTINNDGDTETISGLLADTYTIEIADANGCVSTCVIVIELVDIQIEKTVSFGPEPTTNPNEFTISYILEVINDGSGTEQYDISDTIKYGLGAVVSSSSVSYLGGIGEVLSGIDNSANFDGLTDFLISDNETIISGGREEWEVTVVFTVVPTTVTTESEDCILETSEAGTGLLNCAAIGGDVPEDVDEDCSTIPVIMVEIEKEIVSLPQPTGVPNNFTITYTISVTNSGNTLATYDLSDTLKYGEGAVVETVAASYLGGVNEMLTGLDNSPNYDGMVDYNLVQGESLDIGNSEAWEVTVVFSVEPAVTTINTADCTIDTGEQGTGLLNCAAAGGDVPSVVDDVCTEIPMPAVSIEKAISLGPEPIVGASGQLIEYTITVESVGDAIAYYDLSDTLLFGAGLQIISASVSYNSPGIEILDGIDNTANYDGLSDYLIVTDEAIEPGEIEIWTVSIIVVGDPGVLIDSGADCVLDMGETGTGFLNSAVVSGNVPLDEDEVCEEIELGKIGNFVWFECDGNGVQDLGEEGVPDVVVNLYGASGDLVYTTTTDAMGMYEIDNILEGYYYVEFIISGANIFIQASQGADATIDSDVTGANGYGTTNTMLIEGGSCDFDNWDAGITICTPVGDLIFYDSNMNDVFDESESGINGILINLYKQNFFTGEFEFYASTESGLKPGTPSDDGWFKFCAAPGIYYIEIATPLAGLVAAQVDVGNNEEIDSDIDMFFGPNTSDAFEVECGIAKCDLGAGFYLMATAGDRVWRDDNGNGMQDENEPTLSDITVELYDNTGTKIQEATTNSEGEYYMDYLQKEEYYFKVIAPGGFAPTIANIGSDMEDSDISGANGPGTTEYYLMEPGQHIPHVDIGLINDILPVSYLEFSGEKKMEFNLINWITTIEVNNKQFEIQRSINGSVFETIGVVEGRGNTSTISEYSFKDFDVRSNGDYYYRLRQMDFDYNTSLSNVIVLYRLNKGSLLTAYPNPVTEILNLGIHIDEEVNSYELKVMDMKGKLVYFNVLKGKDKVGSLEYKINVQDFVPGVYNISVNIDGNTFYKRFVKTK